MGRLFVPEGLRKLAGGDNHRTGPQKDFAPAGAVERWENWDGAIAAVFSTPAGAKSESPQEALVEIDTAALQEFEIFLLEGPFPMMFLLPGDIISHDFAMRRADGECAVTFLPRERSITGFIMHPFRGNRLDVANDVGKTRGGGQAEEEMNVISHAADGLGNGTRGSGHAAKIGVEAVAAFFRDPGFAVFRREDDVEMEGKVG